MATLNYSRLCKKITFLSSNAYPLGQKTLIQVNFNRFKASSSASAVKISSEEPETLDGKDFKNHQNETSRKPLQNQIPILSASVSPPQNIDLSFNNTKECYKSKKTSELMRAFIVLKLCSYRFLVDNNQKLIKLGQKVLGKRMFRILMKSTFYGHFVAGENASEMIPKVNHLRNFGVKSIFDYSAEDEIQENSDPTVTNPIQHTSSPTDKPKVGRENPQADHMKKFTANSEFADARKFGATARSYFYLGEAQCEKNMEIFLSCIDSVVNITHQTGLAAIKLTALCRPHLLMMLSQAITETKSLLPKTLHNANSLSESLGTEKSDLQLIQGLNDNQRMLLNLLSWNGMIPASDIIHHFTSNRKGSFNFNPSQSLLNPEEEEMFRNLIRRIETLACHARDNDVRIMIDAEQSYLQPAINRITMEMMKKYNKNKSVVFNTYQCYLKSTFDTMLLDLSQSRVFDFYFGAKLVRGAYMEQERHRAYKMGYEDPINDNYEATTAMYHKTLDYLMEEMAKHDPITKRIAIMVASHNEDTVRFAVENMERLKISPKHKVICFGQLFAMSDHISLSLGQSGYSVYKYIPYGPVDEVLPYLSRRAIENSSILAKAGRERNLIRKEIVRRLVSGEWLHKPIGNYTPV